MTIPITLASGSAIRREILAKAGVEFVVERPGVDESELKNSWDGDLPGLASALADAKCLEVAKAFGGLVIGSDQILEFQGRAYDKPRSMHEARARMIEMAGKSHTLINATTIARDGQIIWRHVERPVLTLRPLTTTEVDDYLDAAGDDILSSVGAYQVEKLGARLFLSIEGDYYAVLGLSLFPLLSCLRNEGAIAF